MAYDDIVKALTIQISADDLTGGAWSSVGKGAKDVWNNVTALNQAWELGVKAYNAISSAMDKPIAILSAGGAYAEAAAGFNSLANSYNVDGNRVINSIRDISDGMAGLMTATQAASNAISKGFSESQIETIMAFSKKYSDTVGGDFLQINETIIKAIMTGQARTAAQFGLVIQKGMEVNDVMAQIRTRTEAMGEGAFNFGDKWTGMMQSVDDAYLKIYAGLNTLVGAEGFGLLATEFRAVMKGIEDNAATIATGIFVIVKDTVMAIASPIATAFELFQDMFGEVFSSADDMGIKVKTVIIGIGNTIYDVAIASSQVINAIFQPLDISLRAVAKGMSNMIENMIRVNDFTGFYSEDKISALREYGATLAEVYNLGLVKIDIGAIIKKQSDFNKQVMEAGTAAKSVSKEHENMSNGLGKVGEAFEKMGKNAIKASKDVILSSEEINKYGGILFQANMLAQAGKIGTKEYNDLMAKASTGSAKVTGTATQTASTGTTSQNAVSKSSQQVIKIQVEGKDGAMKELIEEIIERVTTKAVAEGLITAGV